MRGPWSIFAKPVLFLERAKGLDPLADRLAAAIDATLRDPRVRDALSGSWLGHPVHPVLVTVPIGSWLSASILDLTDSNPAAARRLVGVGVVGALLAAVTGASDWRRTSGAARRVGVVHALANWVGIACYATSWRLRAKGRQQAGVICAIIGLVLIGVGGYLGGHLAYALAVNVSIDPAAASANRADQPTNPVQR